ncbi:hypothetical protein GCM10010260_57890 [Streptomyces filipinensis]|uniref:Lipoprotein n=1 Tax=Streptomyces filipinensis TaxID=66887 RepID=A0A918IHL3_9ACTN|nr:hypothetical protein [Streptomyces filipinensis]GGV11589.1 hypothetical protein GCM10010260_57890 [Streptomyces filipinensis]
MNRMRTTAVLATTGLLTAAQLGLAGGAFAAAKTPSSSSGCPLTLSYPTRFYINSNHWVTNGGLYFGIKNKSTTKSFKKVSFTVTDVANIRFGSAKATGGRVTHKTSKTVTVYTGTLNKKASLGVKVQTHLLNTHSYKVKFTLRGSGWTCAVNQGTWGN